MLPQVLFLIVERWLCLLSILFDSSVSLDDFCVTHKRWIYWVAQFMPIFLIRRCKSSIAIVENFILYHAFIMDNCLFSVLYWKKKTKNESQTVASSFHPENKFKPTIALFHFQYFNIHLLRLFCSVWNKRSIFCVANCQKRKANEIYVYRNWSLITMIYGRS